MLIMKMPNSFTPAQLSERVLMKNTHMSKATLKNRIECLERVMLLSPTLPLAERVFWPCTEVAYCTRCRDVWTTSTGSKFQNAINLMVHELGTHYEGYARVCAARTEQDKAFLVKYQTKALNNVNAFSEFYQSIKWWLPVSLTSCST